MRFERSPLARFGIQAVLLVAAVALGLKASSVAAAGARALVLFLAVVAAVLAPVALDLWAKVEADRTGIRWRNRVRTRGLRWDEVEGFEHGPSCMVLRRVGGRAEPLQALGLRYFGSRRMAEQRVRALEQLRRG